MNHRAITRDETDTMKFPQTYPNTCEEKTSNRILVALASDLPCHEANYLITYDGQKVPILVCR